MSYYTRTPGGIVITTHPVFAGGLTNPPIDEIFAPGEEGWDTLTIHYLHPVPLLTPESLATLYPKGAKLGLRKFWLVNAIPRRIAPGLWIAEVAFKGWAAEKPVKVRIGSAAEQRQTDDALLPTGGTGKLATQQNTPTISLTYLVEDAADPLVEMTSKVGTAVTPPITIDPPPNTWPGLAEPLHHFPNGWVLMGSEQDRLHGTTAALVTDTYKYIQPTSPG